MRRALVVLILAVVIAPYYVRLGVPDLWDVNETLYAEPPREALETGEWLVPTMNYEPWFVKPPGVTWITMPFYAVLGPTELAGRLPMALAATLTILLVWWIGRRTAGERAGVLAAVVLATTAKHWMFSRQLAGDVFLTTGFTLAVCGYLRWFSSDGRQRGGLWIAAVSLGLGTLLKGPIALLLPGLFVPLHLWAAGRLALLRRLRPTGPAALAIGLAAPWFVYASVRYGEDFYGTYFGFHHFARFLTDELGSRGPFYYPPVFLADILPWGAALPAAVWVCVRRGWHRQEPWRSAWVWSLFLLVFFSISAGKREVYLLPIYPFVALLVGATIDRLARERAWGQARWVVGPLLPVAVLVVAGGVWVAVAVPLLAAQAIGVAAIGALWAVLLAWRLRRHDVLAAAAVTAGVTVCAALWVASNQDLMQDARPAREFAAYAEAHGVPGDRLGRYEVGLHSLSFYGHRPCFVPHDAAELQAECHRAPQTWIAMPEGRLADLTGDTTLHADVVLRRVYLRVSSGALLGRKNKKLEKSVVLVKVTPRKE